MNTALDVYGCALRRPTEPLVVRSIDRGPEAAQLARWLGPLASVDERVLSRASGPVLDIGCGPGRHVRALARQGIAALGVEVSPEAIRVARKRGAAVLAASVFDSLPGAGNWRCALLLDGNIGIGANPVLLLDRLAALLAPHGEALVELERPGAGVRQVLLRLEHGRSTSAWFYWARVAADTIDCLAGQANFAVAEHWSDGGRWFARLKRR
jgi:SAM-dependent methyltransferase